MINVFILTNLRTNKNKFRNKKFTVKPDIKYVREPFSIVFRYTDWPIQYIYSQLINWATYIHQFVEKKAASVIISSTTTGRQFRRIQVGTSTHIIRKKTNWRIGSIDNNSEESQGTRTPSFTTCHSFFYLSVALLSSTCHR